MSEPKNRVRIALVGKYVDLKESYKSLHEALVHGAIANGSHIEIDYIDSVVHELRCTDYKITIF